MGSIPAGSTKNRPVAYANEDGFLGTPCKGSELANFGCGSSQVCKANLAVETIKRRKRISFIVTEIRQTHSSAFPQGVHFRLIPFLRRQFASLRSKPGDNLFVAFPLYQKPSRCLCKRGRFFFCFLLFSAGKNELKNTQTIIIGSQNGSLPTNKKRCDPPL